MNPVEREAALAKIKNKPDVQVILISFKAGSTGKCPLHGECSLLNRLVPRAQFDVLQQCDLSRSVVEPCT